MTETHPIQKLTDQTLLQALAQANWDMGELGGQQGKMAAGRHRRCTDEIVRRWGDAADENLSSYWAVTRATAQDMVSETDDPDQTARLVAIARHGYPLGANDPDHGPSLLPATPPLGQTFADYREDDLVTITPKATRLFEVVRVTDEGMQVAALSGDGAENLQWVVSLDHVRLIRRPDPEPSTGHGPACDHDKDDAGLYALDNGDVNILLSLAGIKRLQLQRELRGADQKTREEIIQYDMDPAHLDRIIAKLRRQA